jgi:hypothetical protein
MIGYVRDVLRVLRLPCRELTALFSKQLDEPLPPGIAAGLRIHRLYCGGCARFRAQILRLRDLAGAIGQELDSGDAMPQAVRDRVLRRTSEQSKKM